jgi:hypothetical protein
MAIVVLGKNQHRILLNSSLHISSICASAPQRENSLFFTETYISRAEALRRRVKKSRQSIGRN